MASRVGGFFLRIGETDLFLRHSCSSDIFVRWSSISLCCTTIEFRGISADRKEFMVDCFLADIGIGVVRPLCSSPLATSRFVLICIGVELVALGFVE